MVLQRTPCRITGAGKEAGVSTTLGALYKEGRRQQVILFFQIMLLSRRKVLILVAAQVLLADGRTVPFTAAAKKKIQAEVDTMAASALRCLAFAQKTDLPAFASYDGSLSHPVRSPHWAHPLHSTSWALFNDMHMGTCCGLCPIM